tara:strand:+ start:1373 stop:1648 length:276 start_codon:yes stop_codon:yes gene_type:complete
MKTHIKISEDAVRNWFGNRGYPIDDTSRITFRVVDSKSRWIFIRDSHDEYEEVIAYPMDSMCFEPYDGWPTKGFSWAKKNLEQLVDRLEQA